MKLAQDAAKEIKELFKGCENSYDLAIKLLKKDNNLYEDFPVNIIFELLKLSNQPLPIESAPKDGTVIDVFSPCIGRTPNAFYDKTTHSIVGWKTKYDMLGESPTHWLPIPQVKGE